MEFSNEEIKLINKMIDSYWVQNNNEHPDNLEDWRKTFNIVEKLIIPDVSKCVFCDNKSYKKGAAYCIKHMASYDYS